MQTHNNQEIEPGMFLFGPVPQSKHGTNKTAYHIVVSRTEKTFKTFYYLIDVISGVREAGNLTRPENFISVDSETIDEDIMYALIEAVEGEDESG